MQKILNFFKQSAGKIGDMFKAAKDKVFWKQAKEERRKKMIIQIGWAVVIVVIIIAAIWLIMAQVGSKPKVESVIANPIAEAKLTVVTSRACGSKCWDSQLFTDALTAQNISITNQETVYVSRWWPFGKGKAIAKQYQISKVPTVIVEFTGDNQPDITKFFSPALGAVIDGKFVLTKILAPYYDLTANKLKGLIKVTYLTDKSCNECYDVKKHDTALKNLGASTANIETVDVSSAAGKELIKKYGITKVPTLLISGEVSEYDVLTQAWAEVGTIAEDGTYIFTNLDLMGDSYKDLSTGQVVKAKEQVAAPAVK